MTEGDPHLKSIAILQVRIVLSFKKYDNMTYFYVFGKKY